MPSFRLLVLLPIHHFPCHSLYQIIFFTLPSYYSCLRFLFSSVIFLLLISFSTTLSIILPFLFNFIPFLYDMIITTSSPFSYYPQRFLPFLMRRFSHSFTLSLLHLVTSSSNHSIINHCLYTPNYFPPSSLPIFPSLSPSSTVLPLSCPYSATQSLRRPATLFLRPGWRQP